ncbi:MAG: tRNA glutamyl-Q(34) synthetase GluQRS, partial [Sporomusa sp.]
MRIVRGRFAPSPTGEIHLGNVWTALLAWLQVRSAGGCMVLRMEDLDPERSRQEYAVRLMADMTWLGLDWDEGPDIGGQYAPYNQAQRRDLYQQALVCLEKAGLVYPCYCTRAELAASAPHTGENERVYLGTCRLKAAVDDCKACRRPALRLAVPAGEYSFTDMHAGFVCQDVSRDVGDFVIRRSDGVHAYQLAVVVDDAAMGITHVVRGHDLLNSTPRQLLLYRLLGLQAPVFTHVPLLVDSAGCRLSKRQRS